MKRRSFGLLAGSSLAALKFGYPTPSRAAVADPALLTTTLTPSGGERAGNADGSIPAWTGGVTTVPAGWDPSQAMPDIYADEQPLLTVDASNMAQHADLLSEGTMKLMSKYGQSIRVFKTHRSAAAPQWVYDNIAKNVTRSVFLPSGGRFGFTGGWGGVPFPIPDTSDPLKAGAQIMWNSDCRWVGFGRVYRDNAYVVNSGVPILSTTAIQHFDWPYYGADGFNESNFKGILFRARVLADNPANVTGFQDITWERTNSPAISWEVLAGQGRVRKAPEVAYDIPASPTDGQINWDEYFGFTGALDRYDWKYIGKKELYIPYNNNGIFLLKAEDILKKHFVDPAVVRWEKHRVWVVEATVHPGERNVLARRRFYVDEDTWDIGCVDAWDAGGNLFHVAQTYQALRPDVPTLYTASVAVYNLQTDNYCVPSGHFNEKEHPTLRFLEQNKSYPTGTFDPQSMAASTQY